MSDLNVDVVVVGAGPAGLSAAIELRRRGVERVVVVEREAQPGGVPRHCHHLGFGLRDLHRSYSGPTYAKELFARAQHSGAQIMLSTTVTEFVGGTLVRVVNENGINDVRTRAVLLATGVRERPRSARLVAGDRPAGVFTTGQLQQWTYVKHLPVGTRALVVGAEHVSFSAMLTLRHAGVKVIALSTEHEGHQSVTILASTLRTSLRVPLWSRTKVVAIEGKDRVRGVVIEDLVTGHRRSVDVDTVVFTGDWIPDNELSRRGGLDIDAGTRGPGTDAAGRTSSKGVYAAGNLVHPVETADVAALRGRSIAAHLALDVLHESRRDEKTRISVTVESPLLWVWPNRIDVATPIKKFSLRASTFSRKRRVTATQDGVIIGYSKVTSVVPNRALSLSGSLIADAKPEGGPIHFTLGNVGS